MVLSVCKDVQGFSRLSKMRTNYRQWSVCDISDGVYSQGVQTFLCSSAYSQQTFCGQGMDNLFIFFNRDNCHSIRLFIIAAKLCEYFVKAYSYADSYSQFVFYPTADFICDFGALFYVFYISRNIKPGFVKSERFYHIGVVGVYPCCHFRETQVLVKMWFDHYKLFAFFFCLPYSFTGFDFIFFCYFIFCQNNTMAVFDASAYGNGFLSDIRIMQTFHTCIKSVAVTVQYDSHIIFFLTTNIIKRTDVL